MSRRFVVAALSAGALTLGGIGAAQGFVPFRARWPGATAEYRVNAAQFPAGSAQLGEVEDQLKAWNQVDGCEFLFTQRLVTRGDSALSHGDAVSGVAFSDRMQRNVLGVAFSNDRGQRRLASDVNFNSRTNWVFGRAPRSSREYHFGSTCAHEFGHAIGLQHSDRGCRALMGGGCGSPGRVRQFSADDLAGARFLYPGASRVTPGASGSPAARPDWALDTVRVSTNSPQPGDTLNVTVTGVQRGTADASRVPPVWFVLSSNQTISTQDAVLLRVGEQATPFASGARFTLTRQLTLPASATGERFLGVVIDPEQDVAEVDEANNTSAARLQIQAPPAPDQDWALQVTLSPDSLQEGQTVELSYRLTNLGVATNDVPEVQLYLSSNDTITTRDTLLETIPAGAGAAREGRRSFQATLAPGEYFLGAIVDASNLVAELREDNNTAAARLTVLPPPAAPQQGPAPAASASPGTPGGAASSQASASGSTAAGATAAPTAATASPSTQGSAPSPQASASGSTAAGATAAPTAATASPNTAPGGSRSGSGGCSLRCQNGEGPLPALLALALGGLLWLGRRALT